MHLTYFGYEEWMYLSISFRLLLCWWFILQKKRVLCVVLSYTLSYSHCHTPCYHHQSNLNIQQNNFVFNTLTFFCSEKKKHKKTSTHWRSNTSSSLFSFSLAPPLSLSLSTFLSFCVYFCFDSTFLCVFFFSCLVSVQHFHRLMACHKNARFQHIKMHGCR